MRQPAAYEERSVRRKHYQYISNTVWNLERWIDNRKGETAKEISDGRIVFDCRGGKVMIWENGISDMQLTYVKMEPPVQVWYDMRCLGLVHWADLEDGMGGVGGGFRWNTCKTMFYLFCQCMAKPMLTLNEKKKFQLKTQKKKSSINKERKEKKGKCMNKS